MKVRLNLIGDSSATLVDESGETPLTTSARLLFHLAVAPSEGLFRNELALELWPDDEPAACRNRLRVALSKLRSRVPGIVAETKGRLILNSDIAAIDLLRVKEEAAAVEDEVSPIHELAGWMRLKEALQCDLAPGLESSAFDASRSDWREWAGSKLRRGAELALGLNRYDSAQDLALAGLSQSPDDPDMWGVLLAACRAAGDLQPARRVYARLKAVAKQAGKDFGGDVPAIERALREAGGSYEAESSNEARRFSDSLLKEGLAVRPELVLPLLAAPQLLPLVGGNPRQAADLLAVAVEKAPPDVPDWPRCAGRLIGLWAWLDESQKVQNLAPKVLQSTGDPLIRKAVFNALAASLALSGLWQEADEALAQTKRLAEEAGSLLDAINVEGNRACYWWMQGRFDEADRLYGKVLADLKLFEEPRARFDEAVAIGNRAFIPVMQGRFEEGRRQLEEAGAWRSANGIDLPAGLEGPCLAMLKVRGGEISGSGRQMRQALMILFDQRSIRMQLAGLEYAALSLLWIGRTESALRSLEKLDEWRTGSGFCRCEAERQMTAAALQQAPQSEFEPAGDCPDLSSPEQLGAWIVRALRQAELSQRGKRGAASQSAEVS